MILTQCPVCAVALPALTAKQCSRCKTRYCGPACQKTHWEEGGHDKLCRKIRKGGGAEQYHANTKYTAAVAVAAEACAEDTKGQTCYICTQALHWKTKEGLVRGCSCRGTAGFAHVSCLAEEAKTLCAEAEENNLDVKVQQARWNRWHTCGLCEQMYHGVVCCALSWACWKTYLGRPETNQARLLAMSVLGAGLGSARQGDDALSVQEAELSMLRRVGASALSIHNARSNLAFSYGDLGRLDEALRLKRDIYRESLRLFGEEHGDTLTVASNYASTLNRLERFEEVKTLLRKTIPAARRVLGENDEITLRMRCHHADALCKDSPATLDDLREAVSTFEEIERIARRVLGGAHPIVEEIERRLPPSRKLLLSRAALSAHGISHGDVESFCEAMAAMTPGEASDDTSTPAAPQK